MKRILFLVILFTIATITFSQHTNSSPTLTKQEDHLKKRRHQKTAAWVFLGAGDLSSGIGSVQTNPDYGSSSNNTGFLIAGLVAIGASIPLFIASAHNKHKAASLALKTEAVPQIYETSMVYHRVPSLTLKIRL